MTDVELITSKELAPFFIDLAARMFARGLSERNQLPFESQSKFIEAMFQSQKNLLEELMKMNLEESKIELIANKGVLYYQYQVLLGSAR